MERFEIDVLVVQWGMTVQLPRSTGRVLAFAGFAWRRAIEAGNGD